MDAILLIVPCTYGVPSLSVFDGLRVVVLDDLLMSGFAAHYFRRLFVQAMMEPSKRGEFELRRQQYLARVLREITLNERVVVVGTRASDVDLLDFQSVYAVRISDHGLRSMSRAVYGDPVMLYMDYHSVLAAVEQAVDETYVVAEWKEVPLLVMRNFPDRPNVDVVLQLSHQKAILREVLSGVEDAHRWLEDVVFRPGSEKRTMLLADYDYLAFVIPYWRDAVARILGKAPSIAQVFRLPWCIVDSNALTSMCYRSDVHGKPTASARGHSLIHFVQTRLAGVMTPRELIGTWVGGLLCDDVTAIDTVASLGDKVLAPAGVPDADFPQRGGLCVPHDYAWMYVAVGGVSVKEWEGERKVDGSPKFDATDVNGPWALSVSIAELYADVEKDSLLATAVVQFLSRLHAVNVDVRALARLREVARSVVLDGCTGANFDSILVPMLPGYSYLTMFLPSVRFGAALALGCCPGLVSTLAYARKLNLTDANVSVDELCADFARLFVHSGKSLPMQEMVGHSFVPKVVDVVNYRPGYCYQCLFRPQYRAKARRLLGAYPKLRDLMDKRYLSWYVDNAWQTVRVSHGCYVGLDCVKTPVLHMAIGGDGLPFGEYVRTDRTLSSVNAKALLRVGQSGVCYSSTWYVMAIVAWTIVGCYALGVIVWLCVRRGRGGSGGGIGRYR